MVDRLGWNPWRALRDRAHVLFGVDRLPAQLGGGVYIPSGDHAVILLDRSLTATERNAALAHELCHDDMPGASEAQVCDEVARRLVPLDELAQLVASICDDGTPVHAWEIAEAFDVPEAVAVRACELLKRQEGELWAAM